MQIQPGARAAFHRGTASLALAASIAWLTPAWFTPALAASGPAVEFIQSDAAKAAGFPFSQAVRVDSLLFLSGQIGYDAAAGKLAAGGMAAETRQTMDNIKALLASRGLGTDSLVKCTVMLADMSEWAAFNEIYRTYFPNGRFPARSAFGANGLALGARVEVECIAAVPAGD